MAVELAAARRTSPSERDPAIARLRGALDLEALIAVGYDPGAQVFAPSLEHPIFGFEECAVRDCEGVAVQAGMCGPCARRWRRGPSSGMSREEFIAAPRLQIVLGRKRQVLCRVCCVPGFERPAAGPLGLCLLCTRTFRRSLVPSVDEWIAGGQRRPGRRTPRPPAQPRPTYGRCERCGRWAAHPRPRSCQPCRFRWRELGRPDWEVWCREHPARAAVDNGVLTFSASVPERLRLEFLIGVQDAIDGELKFNAWGDLTRLAARLARMGVESVLELEEAPTGSAAAEMLLKRIQWSVEKTLVDTEAELARNVWRLGLLRRDGARQNLDLTTLTQPWLRELFRDWAREALGTTRNVVYLNATLCQIRRLSESLRNRPDDGNDMTAVGRRDIEQFLMRLAGLASSGRIANVTHCDCVIMVRSVLRRARDRGLTAPGGLLDGLRDTFAVFESDSPQREERDPDD
jgi:hypothetical protein